MYEVPVPTTATHYPGHLRDAFDQWVEIGCPDTATVEINYEPREEPTVEFLASFVDCEDVMPGEFCAEVAGCVAYPDDRRGMTYSEAARALLAYRQAGPVAAASFLDATNDAVLSDA